MPSGFAMGRTANRRARRLAGSLNASPPSGSGGEDRAERSAISTRIVPAPVAQPPSVERDGERPLGPAGAAQYATSTVTANPDQPTTIAAVLLKMIPSPPASDSTPRPAPAVTKQQPPYS